MSSSNHNNKKPSKRDEPPPGKNLRWIEMSESEKKEVFRQRNIANLRRSRQKKKMEEIEDRKIFEENEKKIRQLESMAKAMEKELKKR